MPTRKIPLKHKSLSGVMPTGRDPDRLVAHESALERDYALLQEFSSEVAWFEEQPVTFPYLHPSGTTRPYTPDFLVRYYDPGRPPTLAEIKYQVELVRDEKELAPRFDAGREYAAEHGWVYDIASEIEIRTPLLKSVKFLLPFRSDPPTDEMTDLVMRLVTAHQPITVSALVLRLSAASGQDPAWMFPCIWYQVAVHDLYTDLHKLLSNNTVLSLPQFTSKEGVTL
jgi:hypothetical protein